MAHGGHIAKAQRAARLHLAGINGHDTAAEDLGHIGTGVDAEGKGADHQAVAAGGKDHEVPDQQLYHHRRAADDGQVDLAHSVGNGQEEAAHAGHLRAVLVPGDTDQRHHHAQHHTDEQGDHGHKQSVFQTLHIQTVALVKDKAFVNIKAQILQPLGQVKDPLRGYGRPQFRRTGSHNVNSLVCHNPAVKRGRKDDVTQTRRRIQIR